MIQPVIVEGIIKEYISHKRKKNRIIKFQEKKCLKKVEDVINYYGYMNGGGGV